MQWAPTYIDLVHNAPKDIDMNNDRRLEIERRVIRKYLMTLIKAGYILNVCDGEEQHAPTGKVTELLEQITAVDEARVIVRAAGTSSFLFFVMGNAPGEVLNDYGVSLEEVIAPINEWAEQYC